MDSLSLSEKVSVTALAISLVALITTITSFVQAFLGTAEGYRRCAESVIGPWSALRRREIRWGELRAETKFVTPLIVLVPPHDEAKAEGSHPNADEIYLLNTTHDHAAEKQNHESVWQKLMFWKRRYDPGGVLDTSMHLDIFNHETISKGSNLADSASKGSSQDNVANESVLEKGNGVDSREEENDGKNEQSVKPWKQKRGPRNGLPVTWIQLLRELHVLYLSYWPYEDYSCKQTCQQVKGGRSEQDVVQFGDDAIKAEIENDAKQRQNPKWQNSARTKVAIVPCEETWDFMPPDVSRPLASATMGNIMVLAMRLGMQWRALDGAGGKLHADGKGFSMSSMDVKGMGVVLKFSAPTRRDAIDLVIPSRAVDKLMCGIIPGDTELVKQDFDLVNRGRKLLPLHQEGGVLEKLGLPQESVEFVGKRDRWETHNETITLLCTFLPLPCSHLSTYYFAGWKGRQHSVFRFMEPRLGLLNALRALRMTNSSTVIKEVLDHFDQLLATFKYEFWNGSHEEVPDDRDTVQRKVRLANLCRAQFERTTEYFKQHDYHLTNGSDKTWYMQLVAAHARMSASALKRGLDAMRKEDGDRDPRSQGDILDEYESIISAEGIKTRYWADRLYRMAAVYAEDVTHPHWGVVRYMRERAFPSSDEQIHEAWWMLMLRGIVWTLSSECMPFPGEPVPSSYYDDETTVWIT